MLPIVLQSLTCRATCLPDMLSSGFWNPDSWVPVPSFVGSSTQFHRFWNRDSHTTPQAGRPEMTRASWHFEKPGHGCLPLVY